MGKQQRSISLDEELNELLKNREHLNASSIVNKLLDAYLCGGDDTVAVAQQVRLRDIEDRIEDTERKIDRLQSQLENLRDERDRIEEQIDRERSEQDEVITEFRELFGVIDNPENEIVDTWAGKAGMPPTQFVEAVKNGGYS